MNDKDLIEFFIYLRDHCYNRDFQIEPKKVVECFHEYRQQGYKLPIHAVMGELPDNHVCRYSKAMNQPYPRLCVDCGKSEGN
jgi:hypothetical protein